MEWLEVVFLLHVDARSHNFSCLATFFNLPPYAEREKNHLNIGVLLLPMAGIKPGLYEQQVSVPSITPLPLGKRVTQTYLL